MWILADHGLLSIPKPPKPLRPSMTARRYGAGMAHTIASMAYLGLWIVAASQMIIDYDGLRWITMDYRGLITTTYNGSRWITVDYDRFRWITIDYGALRWITMDYDGL